MWSDMEPEVKSSISEILTQHCFEVVLTKVNNIPVYMIPTN